MATFTCSRCRLEKPIQTTGGTGYAMNDKNEKICYACCALDDQEYMQTHDRITLYYHGNTVTNWPGTLSIKPTGQRVGKHNMPNCKTVTVWFVLDGTRWWGRQIDSGYTELLHCHKMK